jgi:hypothetical protein
MAIEVHLYSRHQANNIKNDSRSAQRELALNNTFSIISEQQILNKLEKKTCSTVSISAASNSKVRTCEYTY